MAENFFKRFGYFNHFIRNLRMQQALKWIKGDSVLDVGCEFGILSTMLSDGINYLGIDDDLSAIEIAREFSDKNKKFLHMVIDEKTLDIGKFDNIVLCAVIEHMANFNDVLKNLRKNLNLSGRLIIITPTKKSDKILKYGSEIGLFHKESIDEHCHYFDKKALFNLNEDLKLKVIHYNVFELGFNQTIVSQKS